MNPVDPTMPTSREPHPIQGLMETALNSIKGMIDVTTVVGEPIHTQDGSTIIPVSRVSLGFAAGGGEYAGGASGTHRPFGGGSGAGVSVQPIGFLVQRGEHVRVLSVDGGDFWDRLIDFAPDAVGAIEDILLGRRREASPDPHAYDGGIDGP